MRTFRVSDVAPATSPLPAITLAESFAARLGALERAARPEAGGAPGPALEASGANQERLVRPAQLEAATHPVIEAVHTAFAAHYPLALSPDDVWLCLAQGLALHVEANAEALRARFVRHAGKLTLQLRRDGFIKGSPDNDWQGCFAEWSDAIAAHIGKQRDLVVASFSTTGPIERAASELVLMSAMKGYFSFELLTLCGIPAITLLGTVEDWRAIRRRAEVFAELGLGEWVAALRPVLDQFVAAAAGDIELGFWRSIYKQNGGSGGPYVTGWINVLFPYLDTGSFNDSALTWRDEMDARFRGTTLSAFPRGLSAAPLSWHYLGTQLSMTLYGGFVGIAQEPATGAVRPAIGWAVQEAAG